MKNAFLSLAILLLILLLSPSFVFAQEEPDLNNAKALSFSFNNFNLGFNTSSLILSVYF